MVQYVGLSCQKQPNSFYWRLNHTTILQARKEASAASFSHQHCTVNRYQFQLFFWLSGGIESNLSLVHDISFFLVYENAKIRIGIKNRNSTQISSTNCFYFSGIYPYVQKIRLFKILLCYLCFSRLLCNNRQFKNILTDLHPQKWLVRRHQSISLQIKVRVCRILAFTTIRRGRQSENNERGITVFCLLHLGPRREPSRCV